MVSRERSVELLDLPPEMLLNVIHFLDFEDICALRESCGILLDLCRDFMKEQTTFIRNMRGIFPEGFLVFNGQCILQKRRVKLDDYSAFPTDFCKNFTALSFGRHCDFGIREVLNLLEYFPKLTEIHFKNRYYDPYDTAPVGDFEINETVKRILQNVESLTIDSALLVDPSLKDLLNCMPNLENIEVCLAPIGRSQVFDNFLYLLQTKASKLKYLTIPFYYINKALRALHRIPNGQLQLKGFYCVTEFPEFKSWPIYYPNDEPLKELYNTQLNLESLKIPIRHQQQIEGIAEFHPHLKELALRFHHQFSGLSFMRGLDKLESLTMEFAVPTEFTSCDPDHHVACGLDKIYSQLRSLSILNYKKRDICAGCWERITLSFPNLHSLKVLFVDLDVGSCGHIFKNLQLQSLHLTSCKITDEHLFGTATRAGLSTQRNLKYLNLRLDPITAIPALPNLRELDVFHAEIRSTGNFSKDFPLLRTLSVRGCTLLEFSETDELSTIKYLTLSDCQKYLSPLIRKTFTLLGNLQYKICALEAVELEHHDPPRLRCFPKDIEPRRSLWLHGCGLYK